MRATKLVLFDIDGTLLLTGGAGGRAIRRAVQTAFSLKRLPGGVCPDGRTDPWIVRELLASCDASAKWSGSLSSSFCETYLECLEEEMDKSPVEVLRGVIPLLERLREAPGHCLGLATGNIENGAWLKLRKAGLDHYFSYGGFGSDSEDRAELVRTAVRRGLTACGISEPAATYVIGDTPHDVAHARRAGAHSIAVASGNYGCEALARSNPDFLVDSLHPAHRILEILRNSAFPL
jgi:phosphoglycolate phosphatase